MKIHSMRKVSWVEQPKPFEFAVMYVEDDEEEIRSKIGDAIILKHSLVGNRDFVYHLWRVLVQASETALRAMSYLC